MKKIAKKIFGILIFVLLCFAIFLGYQFIQYKNQEVDEVKREVQAESDAKLQEELLNHEIEKAENFVENINNDVALTILRTSGKITLSHDKTPEDNKWTEWLFNSDIKVYANYNTAFTIETNKIKSVIKDDATITIYYDYHDILLSSVDITELSTSTNKSIFGSSYSPNEMTAFEQIARKSIIEKIDNDANKLQAKINLESYLTTLADTFNVKVQVVEK